MSSPFEVSGVTRRRSVSAIEPDRIADSIGRITGRPTVRRTSSGAPTGLDVAAPQPLPVAEQEDVTDTEDLGDTPEPDAMPSSGGGGGGGFGAMDSTASSAPGWLPVALLGGVLGALYYVVR